MIYCFDLDGTICTDEGGEYEAAKPLLSRIQKIRELYEEGHTIIIDTARGSVTGKVWTLVTIGQLSAWEVPYHTLRVGKKIFADVYVDDKAVNDGSFFDGH